MLKNTSGQTFTVVAFNASGKVTGNAVAITCTLAIDGGSRVALTDVNPVEIGATGVYEFDLTQGETNGHELSFVPASSTSGVEVLGSPSNVIYTTVSSRIPTTLPSEKLAPIFIGDDYASGNGYAISWDVTPPDGTTVGGGACRFGGKFGSNTWLIAGTLSDIGSGEFRASFNLLDADTAGLEPGWYDWSMEIENDTGLEKVQKHGRVYLLRKYS